ncbi:MAG: GNAT family N-acetyltransferase [Pseudomonadota bacterium]
MVLRPAIRADVPALRELLADLASVLGADDDFHATELDLDRFGFSDTPHFRAVLAEDLGKPVGLVTYFWAFSTWRGRPGVYVQDLHVVGSHRGSGVGHALVVAAARAGRAAGCTHLRLSVDGTNETALAFYRRIGLTPRADETICQISDRDFDRLAAG